MENEQPSLASLNNQKPNSLMLVAVVVLLVGVGVVLSRIRGKSLTEAESMNEVSSAQSSPTEAPAVVAGVTDTSSTIDTMRILTVEGGNFYFKPNTLTAKKEQKITLTFKNEGGLHNFVINEFDVKTKTISGNTNDTVEFTPNKTGTFEFYCSVGQHRTMGMKGILTVE